MCIRWRTLPSQGLEMRRNAMRCNAMALMAGWLAGWLELVLGWGNAEAEAKERKHEPT
jgi:hypothetical protein